MKKAVIAVAVVLTVLGLAYFQRAQIAERVLAAGLKSRMAANRLASLPDGLHLALCGAGGPLPAPDASGPCVAVIAGAKLFVVDTGTDGARNLNRMGFPVGSVQAVFLTHFHSDHIDGLGELATLRWAAGDNTLPLPVHGPSGVEQVVAGFNAAYAQDALYRQAHHGDTVAPLSGAGMVAAPFPPPADAALTTVLNDGDLIVEALAVDHAPASPAVAYRFRYRGRSLLISGDTAASEHLEAAAKGVDLLVHEALSPGLVAMMHDAAVENGDNILAKITGDIPDYHTSPVEAANIARSAGVGHLLYYHIVPPLVVPGQTALFLDGAGAVFPNYTVGKDGVAFSLPAGSDEILKTHAGL
ncbi:MAG: MBL fold metallo-hydrolase [Halieaceae bacterium]|jgi:ribonuclease Z|nr:MBL fold metallo-hydrolase [Halieaceae bacterium]